MTDSIMKETYIKSMDEVPASLYYNYDNDVLKAYFTSGNFLIMRKTPSGDTRYYLEDGKRLKSIDDILKVLRKQGNYIGGAGAFSVYNQKPKNLPAVPEEVATLTDEICTLFGKELMEDFYAAGFHLTVKESSKKKKGKQWYLPDGKHVASRNDIVTFMIEKLRPPFTKDFFEQVMDDAAKLMPGVCREDVSILNGNEEAKASLALAIDGSTYREPISPYVSYKGTISNRLFDSLYAKSSALQKRNAAVFSNNHNFEVLATAAKKILGGQERPFLTIGKYQIPTVSVIDVKVRTEPAKITKAKLCSSVCFNDGTKLTFAFEVPFDITETKLKEEYEADMQQNVAATIAREERYVVAPGSPIHDFVYGICKAKEYVSKTYPTRDITVNGNIVLSHKALDETLAYSVSKPIFNGKDKEAAYIDVADTITIRIDSDGKLSECVYLTFSAPDEFLDVAANRLMYELRNIGGNTKCCVDYHIALDTENRGKESLRCYAKLLDTDTGAEIVRINRCLDKRLKSDIETSKTRIPHSCSILLCDAGLCDIKYYMTFNQTENVNAAYEQVKTQFGSLGYQFCKFFGSVNSFRYSRTELIARLGETLKADYKRNAIQDKIGRFLRTQLQLPEDTTIQLFNTDSAKNYYGSFEVFWPSSEYLMRAIAARYEKDTADAIKPSLDDFEDLTKEAQRQLLAEKCDTVRTGEDAFAVILCLEKQPQTVKKAFFTQDHFRDVYMLLNETDRMFADILISDCPGCIKLLKSLQKQAEENA